MDYDDEEEAEAAVRNENRRRYVEAGNYFDEATRVLGRWITDHENDDGFNPLDPELVQLQGQVTEANHRLNDAHRRYIDTCTSSRAVTTDMAELVEQFRGCYRLAKVLIPIFFTNAPTSISSRRLDFKRKLCQFYKCYRRKKQWIRCMVLDVSFPKSVVTAAHLFPRHNEVIANRYMGIHNIDDTRNGMLMFKPLEYAFDRFQLSFIREDDLSFKLKLFDQSICDTKLIDYITEDEKKRVVMDAVLVRGTSVPCDFNITQTFGQIDGRIIQFHNRNRPYNRCLNLQARLAYSIALKRGWIDDSYQFNDFWSDAMSLADQMEMFQNSILENEHQVR
jgi:HNH endonuclease